MTSSGVPHAQDYLDETVTAHVARNPLLSPSTVEKQLLSRQGALHKWLADSPTAHRARHWNWHRGAVDPNNAPPSADELNYVCEHFGYAMDGDERPSELYLQMLADAMLPLPAHPLYGVVSPQLLATTGTVPVSILSTGPDIIQHYYECIVAAKEEVILLTNYWQLGKNVSKISDAIRELDRKAAEAESTIIVKIMWDRGPRSVADLFRARTPVEPNKWEENGLPTPQEVPHLRMEILNYHRPIMGTFHAKLLLVDRRLALINSINIQDRPNLECCIHLEGDIVNSVYDHAMISWGNAFRYKLPCLSKPASHTPATEFMPALSPVERKEASKHALCELVAGDKETMRNEPIRMRVHLADLVGTMMHARAGATDAIDTPITSVPSGKTQDDIVRRAAAMWRSKVHVPALSTSPVATSPGSAPTSPTRHTLAESAMWLLGRDSSSSWNVEMSALRSRPMDPHEAESRLRWISQSLNFANLSQVRGSLDPNKITESKGGWEAQRLMGLLDFEPVIYHTAHAPVPIALVNRRPHGRPGHDDIQNPQDAAWLAGFRYAKHHVFIQSPTLNATPVKHAVLACVRRGVRVQLWLDLGFNDKSESMPFQGGTNEQVVVAMYKALRRDGQGREKLLEVYWYTGKDMDRPLNAVRKQRNCHVCMPIVFFLLTPNRSSLPRLMAKSRFSGVEIKIRRAGSIRRKST